MTSPDLFETIAAISTPPQEAALGVVRLSGPEALPLALKVLRTADGQTPRTVDSRRVYHGLAVHPGDGTPLDEVLWFHLQGPHSYTGENMVEVSCHGGRLVLRAVLEAFLQAGCRLADPGEFTRRAFLNGRMDLSQAEAVMDLIQSRSERGLRLAVNQLQGTLRQEMEALSQAMWDLLIELEARLNFPDDVLDEADTHRMEALLHPVHAKISWLLNHAANQHLCFEGAVVPLVGPPNAGKSSLLNRLLGRERALVSPTPGTTRDFLEETLHLGGFALRLVDTAGLGLPKDDIEAAGQELGRRRTGEADLVLLILDGAVPFSLEERTLLHSLPKEVPLLSVLNKSDLGRNEAKRREIEALVPVYPISALTGEGLDALLEGLQDQVKGLSGEDIDGPVLYALRHRDALRRAESALQRALEAMRTGYSNEFLCFDLREVLDALGEITGATTTEAIVDGIFRRFCIGK